MPFLLGAALGSCSPASCSASTLVTAVWMQTVIKPRRKKREFYLSQTGDYNLRNRFSEALRTEPLIGN